MTPKTFFFFFCFDEDGRRHENRHNFDFLDAKADGTTTKSDSAVTENGGYDDRTAGALGEGGDDPEHVAGRFQGL